MGPPHGAGRGRAGASGAEPLGRAESESLQVSGRRVCAATEGGIAATGLDVRDLGAGPGRYGMAWGAPAVPYCAVRAVELRPCPCVWQFRARTPPICSAVRGSCHGSTSTPWLSQVVP